MSEPDRRIIIRRQPDGTFTVSGDVGVPAFATFIVDGWAQIARLRVEFDAVDHFPVSEDHHAFCERFGAAPN